jgi:hypothetical protein
MRLMKRLGEESVLEMLVIIQIIQLEIIMPSTFQNTEGLSV